MPSWNVDGVPRFRVEMQVASDDGERSPWLLVGAQHGFEVSNPVVDANGSRIATDHLVGDSKWNSARLRLVGRPVAGHDIGDIASARTWICFTDRTGSTPATFDDGPEPPRALWQRALDVPFRSQRDNGPALAPRTCSPTSLAMVLAYHGVDVPTTEVAERAFDDEHDIYGNWPFNTQAACDFGLRAHLERFNDWRAVRRRIANDQPLVISITADVGELRGAPYASTPGHLLVIRGFDANGDVLVADPAARDGATGLTTYARADLETVWMRKGGTAYVVEPAASR
ncbi:MAG: C39 family peptidase [Planctomycetota bacterium]